MIKFFPTLCAIFVAFASMAESCTRAAVSGENRALPTSGKFNSVVLDQAILAESNFRRCKAGLRPMQSVNQLRNPSAKHSDWMARKNRLSHTSTQRGLKTLRDRVNAAGISVRTGAENLASLPLFALTSRYQVVNRAKCKFASPSGQTIGPHSYRSFASSVVTQWMNSPGHRKNILSPGLSGMGSAAALRSDRKTCGMVFVTQMFVG